MLSQKNRAHTMALNNMLPDMSYGKITKEKCYQLPLVVDSGDFSGQPLDSVGKSRMLATVQVDFKCITINGREIINSWVHVREYTMPS